MWVGYWNSLTGDRVEYAPWQSAARRFPDVPRSDFQKAVQYFENGKRYSGAEAVLHLLASVPGWHWTLWLYQHIPGLAAFTEWLYAFVAGHRNAGYRVSRALWGKSAENASYSIASSLFSRALALIYLIAFASFGRQIRGLIGAQGILPVAEFLVEVNDKSELPVSGRRRRSSGGPTANSRSSSSSGVERRWRVSRPLPAPIHGARRPPSPSCSRATCLS